MRAVVLVVAGALTALFVSQFLQLPRATSEPEIAAAVGTAAAGAWTAAAKLTPPKNRTPRS